MSTGISLLQDAVSPPVQVDVDAFSHPGKVRQSNEDHYLVVSFERNMTTLSTSLPRRSIPHQCAETAYGMLVVDGMDGVAISALIELALRTPEWIVHLNEDLAKLFLQRMSQHIKQKEVVLNAQARVGPANTGMRAGLTIACSLGANLLIAHVGDSRAYLFRKGRLYQLTRDLSVVRGLANAGAFSAGGDSNAMLHVQTHVGQLGSGEAPADLGMLRLADGDQVLLCTDGLTNAVSQAAITEALAIRPAARACGALVEQALEGGGRDNITVVLARYSFA